MLKSRPSMPGWGGRDEKETRNDSGCCRFTPGRLRRNTAKLWTLVISTFLLLEQTRCLSAISVWRGSHDPCHELRPWRCKGCLGGRFGLQRARKYDDYEAILFDQPESTAAKPGECVMNRIPNTMIRASAEPENVSTDQPVYPFAAYASRADHRVDVYPQGGGEFSRAYWISWPRRRTTLPRRGLGGDIEHAGVGQAEFRARCVDWWTAWVLVAGHDRQFFHRVLGLFSTEFGLGGRFEMMDEKEQARLTVLEQMLAGRQVKKNEQDDLIKSYQLATAGKNDRDFVGAFAKHLKIATNCC